MSIVAYLALTLGGAGLTLLARPRPNVAQAVGLVALALATLAAFAIVPGERLTLGSGDILGTTAYGRAFLVLGTASGLLIALLGVVTNAPRDLPVVLLGGFGALGLGLSMASPVGAAVAVTVGALGGALMTLDGPPAPRRTEVAVLEFRAVAVAAALALVGLAWTARPIGPLTLAPGAFGLAFAAVLFAVAIRFGAIPFHLATARLADAVPGPALPMLAAWAPAGLAVVALGWIETGVLPAGLDLGAERAVVVTIGLATIVLGAVAAWMQDDLEHLVAYTIVSDAGFILLGLTVLEPSAGGPTRIFILVYLAAKTALGGWAVALASRFGTRRLDDLSGWARRSPTLGIGLALVVVATFGLPGLLAWTVRFRLLELSTGGPLGVIALVGASAALGAYVRLARIGLRPIGEAVAAGPGDRPVRGGGPGGLAPVSIAAALVLVLALVAVAVSGGVAGAAEASGAGGTPGASPGTSGEPGTSPGDGAPSPGVSDGSETSPPTDSGGPSFQPLPTP